LKINNQINICITDPSTVVNKILFIIHSTNNINVSHIFCIVFDVNLWIVINFLAAGNVYGLYKQRLKLNINIVSQYFEVDQRI